MRPERDYYDDFKALFGLLGLLGLLNIPKQSHTLTDQFVKKHARM